MMLVRIDNFCQKFVLIHRPVPVREYLDFIEPVKACLLHPSADPRHIYTTFPHQSAVIEKIYEWKFPVANVKGKQVGIFTAPVDLVFQVGIPPQMVHIYSYPDMG